MQNWSNNLTKHTFKTSKNIRNTVKKAMGIALTAAVLSFGTGASALAADNQLTTVYYVYANDEYVGTISDKKAIENMIAEKLKEAASNHKADDLSLGSEIHFIPEQVLNYHQVTNNSEVAERLSKELSVQAEAFALVINDEPVAYVENEEQANQVLKQLKLKYISEAELAELESRDNAEETDLPALKENESRLLDVKFAEDISISEAKIDPDQINTAEEAMTLLEKGTPEEQKYIVQEGDVLGGIASAHQLDMAALLTLNKGLTEESLIDIGDELNVTVLKPFVNILVEKEVFQKEQIPFENKVIEDASIPKGQTTVQQEGKEGVRAVTYRITDQNGQRIETEELEAEVLEEPVQHIVVKGTKEIPSRGDGSFTWPTVGGYVSSEVGYRWGKMHKGIDIARPSDRTIKAADNGVVVSAGMDGGYGNKIVIDHQNGFRTVYGHLASIDVSSGQIVSEGSKIGVMGSTGDSTGIHLHFELYKNGALENPLSYIR